MFFNVTEPLAEDEELNIHCSNMMVGIRGTCGWIEVPEEGHMNVYILEGQVECSLAESPSEESVPSVAGNTSGDTAQKDTASEKNVISVNAGEMAVLAKDGEASVKPFGILDAPDFVWEELEADEALLKKIQEASGLDFSYLGSGTAVLTMPVTGEEVIECFANEDIDTVIVRGDGGTEELWINLLEAPGKTLYMDDALVSLHYSTLKSLVLQNTTTRFGSSAYHCTLDHIAFAHGNGIELKTCTVGDILVMDGVLSVGDYSQLGDIDVSKGRILIYRNSSAGNITAIDVDKLSLSSSSAENILFQGDLLHLDYSQTGDITLLDGELEIDDNTVTGTISRGSSSAQ